MTIRAFILIVLALLASAHAFADAITLRPSAGVAPGAPVTLADLATLEGEYASSLGGVVIRAQDARGSGVVTMAEVRAALDAHRVNWGRLALRGGPECAVRTGEAIAVTTQSARADNADAEANEDPVAAGGRVRARVVETLTGLFGVDHDDLRVTFDDASRELLATTVAGRRVDVQASAAASSRLMVRVWVYEGDRLIAHGTTRADVRIRVNAVVLRAAVARGDRLTEEHLGTETLWMEPSGAPPVRDQRLAIGAVARTRLDAGTVLRTDHTEAPIVIKRGDLVSVHALAGGLTVRTSARAMADAREGELVELSRSRDRKSFVARASGPGIAVLDATTGAQPEGKP